MVFARTRVARREGKNLHFAGYARWKSQNIWVLVEGEGFVRASMAKRGREGLCLVGFSRWRSLDLWVLARWVNLGGKFSPMSCGWYLVPGDFYGQRWLDWIEFLQPLIFLIFVLCLLL